MPLPTPEEVAKARKEQPLFWTVGPVRPARVRHHHHVHPPYKWEGPIDMGVTITADQQVSFSVSGADDKGNPAPLTGTPVYAVDDTSVLALTDNGDGTCVVAAVGPAGTGTLSVTDAETDGKQFIGGDAITVIAGDVAGVTLTPGTPEAQPSATPDNPPAPDNPAPSGS